MLELHYPHLNFKNLKFLVRFLAEFSLTGCFKKLPVVTRFCPMFCGGQIGRFGSVSEMASGDAYLTKADTRMLAVALGIAPPDAAAKQVDAAAAPAAPGPDGWLELVGAAVLNPVGTLTAALKALELW